MQRDSETPRLTSNLISVAIIYRVWILSKISQLSTKLICCHLITIYLYCICLLRCEYLVPTLLSSASSISNLFLNLQGLRHRLIHFQNNFSTFWGFSRTILRSYLKRSGQVYLSRTFSFVIADRLIYKKADSKNLLLNNFKR